MFFIKRALLYVKRKRSKVFSVGAILFVVSTLVLTGLVIQSASKSAFEYARKSLGASVNYTTDISSVMGDRSGERVPGSGMGMLLPDDFTNITLTEVDEIASGTTLIKDTLINATLAANPSDFSYYNITDEEVTERPRMMAAVNIVGSNYAKTDNIFYNDTNKLLAGRYFTDEEIKSGSNVIIIENTIAVLNDLVVGDSITVSKIIRGIPGSETTEDSEMTFEIVGIYKTGTPTDASATDFRGSFNLSENTMYAPFNTVLTNNGSRIDSVTFTLNNPEDIEEFTTYVEAIGTKYRGLNANDAAYEKMVGPIASVSNTSSILVFVVVIAGGLIIGLLSMLSIKDRKYELGVLLSLGESRIKIIMQLIFEMVIISIVSFALAIVVSNFTAQLTTNFLLNNALTEETTENFSENFGHFRQPTVSADVETIDSLSVSVNMEDSMKMLGLGMLIIIIGNISQALFVLKANPKEILLER